MITHMRIAGLGPHEDTEIALNENGTVTLAGPSECGKTTALEATCFALWGTGSDGKALPVELVRDGAKKAVVTVTLSDGRVLERALGRNRALSRSIGNGTGNPVPYTREDAFVEAVGPIAETGDSARLVLAPMAWVPLSLGPGGGRPFRDALARILPRSNLRQIVLDLMAEGGHVLKDADPLDEKTAFAIRATRNSERDQAFGRLQAVEVLCARLASELVPGSDVAAVATAERTLRSAEEWRAYERAMDAWTEKSNAHAAAVEAGFGWDQRCDALGERPTYDAETLEARSREAAEAEAAVSAARTDYARLSQTLATAKAGLLTRQSARHEDDRALVAAAQAHRDAGRVWGTAKAEADRLRDAAGACPTCKRKGWKTAEDALVAAETAELGAREALGEAEEAMKAALGEAKERLGAAGLEAQAAVRAAELALATATEAGKLLATKASDASERLATARRGEDDAKAWDRALGALGLRPPEPTGTAPAKPQEPSDLPPNEEQVAGARAVLDVGKAATGAQGQRARDTEEAEETRRLATTAHQELVTECARLDALVDAVRRAPSVAASQQLAVLGDLGPVTLRLPAEGPAVEVLVDGRPWWCASTGRQIVADLWLRAGLRRALGIPGLPLWVDRVQDVAGQELPAVEGPVVLLRSQKGPSSWQREG